MFNCWFKELSTKVIKTNEYIKGVPKVFTLYEFHEDIQGDSKVVDTFVLPIYSTSLSEQRKYYY
jgi:hypothetical protein